MNHGKKKSANVISSDFQVRKVLEKLRGRKITGQKREPKWFHPFPARMPVSIAQYLLEELTESNAVILDPMMGSGTTLIAAKKTGRNGIGIDRDYLALRLSRCSISCFQSSELHELRQQILEKATKIIARKSFSLANERAKLPKESQEFVKFWFPSRSQKQLFALSAAIEEQTESPIKDFAWIVFSSLIIAKSAGASYALDIARTRPHRVDEKPIVLPFDAWDRRFCSAISRAPFVDDNLDVKIQLDYGDARELKVPDGTVDFVLTSPPYRNAVDYLRSHKFSLVWMGKPIEEIRELRGTMIGSERGLFELDGIPDGLEQRLTKSINISRNRALIRRYLSDLRKVLGEVSRVLKPNGLALLIVGPTIINAKRTDAENVLQMIGEHVGLSLVGSVIREINAERRSLPAPNTIESDNFLASRMRREAIIALRK